MLLLFFFFSQCKSILNALCWKHHRYWSYLTLNLVALRQWLQYPTYLKCQVFQLCFVHFYITSDLTGQFKSCSILIDWLIELCSVLADLDSFCIFLRHNTLVHLWHKNTRIRCSTVFMFDDFIFFTYCIWSKSGHGNCWWDFVT